MNRQESSHDKNMANFETLVTYCTSYGSTYNPGNISISMSELLAMKSTAKITFNAYLNAEANFIHLRNERNRAFDAVGKFYTKLFHALKASGTSPEKLKNARSITKKINGNRAKDKTDNVVKENDKDIPIKNSTKHNLYEAKLATLNEIIILLQTETNYHPNEEEMTIDGLKNLYQTLYDKNMAVIEAEAFLSHARIERDKLFYDIINNLCDIGLTVKSYVKSIFGAQSDQFRKISKIRFTRF